MPSIDINFLNKLQNNKEYSTFIESGTYCGETIFAVEPHFTKLYTIEINRLQYNITKNRYTGNKIKFMLGDSSIIFRRLLPIIKENAIFFLDGHWSSGNTGRGKKDCPLIEEVTYINNLFKHSAIIIIDDYRLFGKYPEHGCNEDWKDISKEKILDILKNRISNVYHLDSKLSKDDRLIIHINSL